MLLLSFEETIWQKKFREKKMCTWDFAGKTTYFEDKTETEIFSVAFFIIDKQLCWLGAKRIPKRSNSEEFKSVLKIKSNQAQAQRKPTCFTFAFWKTAWRMLRQFLGRVRAMAVPYAFCVDGKTTWVKWRNVSIDQLT